MQISFFEEYPTKANLDKLKFVKWNSRIFVAAKSVSEFEGLRKKILNKNKMVKEVCYWPVLSNADGYWVSPFSRRNALKELIDDLMTAKKPITVLWDAELPMHRKRLFLTELPRFWGNKRIIKRFFRDAKKNKINLVVAEYPIISKLQEHKMRFFGISFSLAKYDHTRCPMYYTSMVKHAMTRSWMRAYLTSAVKEHKDKVCSGLGTIATGVNGNEPILSPEDLG